DRWVDAALQTALLRSMDSEGFARADLWSPGDEAIDPPREVQPAPGTRISAPIRKVLDRIADGMAPTIPDVVTLFGARGHDFEAVCQTADELRAKMSGDVVRYVVNRNINYTNVCTFHCGFCAFSKGRGAASLRGTPYDIDLDEV